MSNIEVLRVAISRLMDPFVALLLFILLVSVFSGIRNRFKNTPLNSKRPPKPTYDRSII